MPLKIELEVSTEHEGTSVPYWLILDPHYATRNAAAMANDIVGPFFSREEAEDVFNSIRHKLSDGAKVFCLSGHLATQYCTARRQADAAARELVVPPTPVDSFDATLTQAERDAPTFLEWSDPSLARMVRHTAKMLHDERGENATFCNAAAITLAVVMQHTNAETMKLDIDGDTKGEDWHLQVRAKLTKKPKKEIRNGHN